MTWTLLSHRREGRNLVLHLRSQPGWLTSLLGAKPREAEFIGECTVWHELPNWRRCSTSMEGMLSEFYAEITHKSSQP